VRLPSPPCSLAALSAPAAVGLSPRASSGKNTSVYVSGLPRDVSEAELAERFGKVGALRKLKVYRMPTGEPKVRCRSTWAWVSLSAVCDRRGTRW